MGEDLVDECSLVGVERSSKEEEVRKSGSGLRNERWVKGGEERKVMRRMGIWTVHGRGS